jgi:excisionase family DNA binding protein
LSDVPICPEPDLSEQIFNVEEAASFLRCGVSTLYHFVCAKKIPYIKMNSRVLFKKSDLITWLDRFRQEPVNWSEPKAAFA